MIGHIKLSVRIFCLQKKSKKYYLLVYLFYALNQDLPMWTLSRKLMPFQKKFSAWRR